jgi:hypothetical protein
VVFLAQRTDKEAADVEENDIDVVEARRRGLPQVLARMPTRSAAG